MNLLFVTDVFPYPPHSGSAVICFHWARHLARRHNVLVLPALLPEDTGAQRQLEALGISTVSVGQPFIEPRGMRHAVALVPMAMHRLRVRELLATLEHLIEAHNPDAVVAISAGLGALLPRWRRDPPMIFVPYDAESLNFEARTRHAAGALRRAYFKVEAMKWRLVEARYYPLANKCIAVSEEDAEVIARRWSARERTRIRVVRSGVDVSYFAPQNLPKIPNSMVISGNMGSIDSVASVRWFLTSVLPRIQHRIPAATVEIVGRDPLPVLSVLTAKNPNVRLHGYVPDLRPYLDRASVYVAPLLFGTGVKNRVLEAMGMAKPVITTPLGVRGLRVHPGRDLITATGEDAFADAVVALLQDADERQQIGQAARQAVIVHHSWASVCNDVEDLLGNLTPAGDLVRSLNEGIRGAAKATHDQH